MFQFLYKFRFSAAVITMISGLLGHNFTTNYTIEIKPRQPNVIVREAPVAPRDFKTPAEFPKEENPVVISRKVTPTVMDAPKSWAYYINNPIIAAIKTSDFDLIVTDTESRIPFSRNDIINMKSGGKKIFVYASLGDAENYRSYWNKEWNSKKPSWIGKEHELWKGNFNVTELLHPEWKEITKKQLSKMMSLGFDGIVISGLSGKDVVSYLEFVHDFIKDRDSTFRILVQDYVDNSILPYIDGVVKQNLVYNYGLDKQSNTDDMLSKLKEIKKAGKHVFIMSYATGAKWALVKEIIKDNGFFGYTGPVKLDVLRIKQE